MTKEFEAAINEAVEKICADEEVQPWQKETIRVIIEKAFSAGVIYTCNALNFD